MLARAMHINGAAYQPFETERQESRLGGFGKDPPIYIYTNFMII